MTLHIRATSILKYFGLSRKVIQARAQAKKNPDFELWCLSKSTREGKVAEGQVIISLGDN